MQKIARLGNFGEQKSHLERDFWRLLDRELPIEIEPYTCSIPYRADDNLGLQLRTHGFVLPHEVFAWLSTHALHSLIYDAHLGRQGVLDFWGAMATEEWYAAHPHRARISSQGSSCIPIRLHGDDCKAIDCWSWTPTQIRIVCRNPFTCIYLESATPETYEHIYRVWNWSMDVLAGGVYPRVGPFGEMFTGHRGHLAGTRFPHDLCGALTQVLCDWKWAVERFQFKQKWNTAEICRDCHFMKGCLLLVFFVFQFCISVLGYCYFCFYLL